MEIMLIKFKFSEKLYTKRFHGNPVKIIPLINSIDPNIREKEKKALKIFFGLNQKNKDVITP